MLSAKDNETICRVGRDSTMGKAMRRYWVPVAMSEEIVAGAPPLDVHILGEHFAGFRDAEGTIGLLEERCCHRGASLLLGRVENCGIRCIYHGWVYAPDGELLETPNVQDDRFKTRIRQPAFPVREAGGIVWAFFGEGAEPPFPDFPFMHVAKSELRVALTIADGNYVQVQEGLLDSTHLGVLHSTNLARLTKGGSSKVSAEGANVFLADLAPTFQAEDTGYGFRYAALRSIAGATVARVTAWVAPFTIMNASGGTASIVVPMSDEVTAFFHIYWGPTEDAEGDLEAFGADKPTVEFYRLTRALHRSPDRPQRENRWLQDRTAMASGESFSGFTGLYADDVAVTSSAGAIRDRSRENLAASDVGIAKLYRRLLDLAQCAQDENALGLDQMATLGDGYFYQKKLGSGEDWRTVRPATADVAVRLPQPA
jgi:phthalate 4,5-dioxygenase